MQLNKSEPVRVCVLCETVKFSVAFIFRVANILKIRFTTWKKQIKCVNHAFPSTKHLCDVTVQLVLYGLEDYSGSTG